jgi:hypothetical protein
MNMPADANHEPASSQRRASLLALRRLWHAPPNRVVWALTLSGLALAIVLDRGYFAQASQWREDQACNIWLGYSRGALSLPVGLISSVGTPNPNGMPLLAVLLTRLPNLWAISTVLGSIQGLLVVWVCWLIVGPKPQFFVLALPALTSVILRATSVEFWNQWILCSVNLAFFGLWIVYVRRRSAYVLAWLTLPMLYAPALYLAGLVNAVLYFVVVVATVWVLPPNVTSKRMAGPVCLGLSIVVLSCCLTWIPYARAMTGKALPGPRLSPGVATQRLLASIESGLDFARWNVTNWREHSAQAFLQSGTPILNDAAKELLRSSTWLLFAQALLFTITLVIVIAARMRTRRLHAEFFVARRRHQGRVIAAGMGFVLLAALISPLLGGPSWTKGERIDQQIQFLPFLLFAWFALPWVVNLPARTGLALRTLSCLCALAFSALSMRAGVEIVTSHLDYRGHALTDADVPLAHQRQAIDFVAHDWMRTSTSKKIPIAYQHGQDWVITFGAKLAPWYPAPMTVGRAFDFELSRVYGLTNTQEGIQNRSAKGARYIVTYAFRDPPRVGRASVRHFTFGRVRVSVLDH